MKTRKIAHKLTQILVTAILRIDERKMWIPAIFWIEKESTPGEVISAWPNQYGIRPPPNSVMQAKTTP
jgi:hypothetical protein